MIHSSLTAPGFFLVSLPTCRGTGGGGGGGPLPREPRGADAFPRRPGPRGRWPVSRGPEAGRAGLVTGARGLHKQEESDGSPAELRAAHSKCCSGLHFGLTLVTSCTLRSLIPPFGKCKRIVALWEMLLKVINALYMKKEYRPLFNTRCDLNLW